MTLNATATSITNWLPNNAYSKGRARSSRDHTPPPSFSTRMLTRLLTWYRDPCQEIGGPTRKQKQHRRHTKAAPLLRERRLN
jgi:hypothetical protein